MLAQGAYPPEADSITIPIAANVMAWVVWAPVFAIVLFFTFRKLKPPVRIFVWAETKRLRSWLVSLSALTPIVLLVDQILGALPWKNYVEIGYSLWWIVIWLLIRAALLTERESNRPSPPVPEGVKRGAGAGAASFPRN